MNRIEGNILYQVTGDHDVSEVPDGLVIYDEAAQQVHYLNPTAAVVYHLCDGRHSVDFVRDFLAEAYDLDDGAEVDGVFHEMEKVGLLCRVT